MTRNDCRVPSSFEKRNMLMDTDQQMAGWAQLLPIAYGNIIFLVSVHFAYGSPLHGFE